MFMISLATDEYPEYDGWDEMDLKNFFCFLKLSWIKKLLK